MHGLEICTGNDARLASAVEAVLAPLPGRVALVAEQLAGGGWLARNATLPLPAASVIKLPVLVALCRSAARGDTSLAQEIEVDVTDPALRDGDQGSGVLRHLRPRRLWTVGELALLMQMVSDNIATNALIDVLGGVEPINRLARELGLAHSALLVKIQDFEALQATNLATAADMARLLRLLHQRLVPGADTALAIMRQQVYNGIIPLHLPPDAEVLHKTGSVEGVVNDVGLVYPHGERARGYAIALLSLGQAPDATARLTLAEVSRLIYDHWGD